MISIKSKAAMAREVLKEEQAIMRSMRRVFDEEPERDVLDLFENGEAPETEFNEDLFKNLDDGTDE